MNGNFAVGGQVQPVSAFEMNTLGVRDLGRREYRPVWEAMREFTNRRDAHSADELWLVEHEPVFTQGQAGKPEHLLAPGEIPVVQVDRGGQVTYHGPGQLVAYPLLDIRRRGLSVKQLVAGIEQAIIELLAEFSIHAGRREGAPGVYVNDAKIASLGLRIRKGRSYHGLALNVDMDTGPFSRINPCGFRGLDVTTMAAETGQSLAVAEISAKLVAQLADKLDYSGVLRLAPGIG